MKINNDGLKIKIVLLNFLLRAACVAEFAALHELAKKLHESKEFEFKLFTKNNAETIKK